MTLKPFTTSVRQLSQKLSNFYEFSGITLAEKHHKEVLLFSTYPKKWMNHYIQQRYTEIDPIHHKGFKQSSYTFARSKTCFKNLNSQQTQLFEDAETHGILSGISFTLKTSGTPTIASYAFPNPKKLTFNLSQKIVSELKLYAELIYNLSNTQKIYPAQHKNLTSFAHHFTDERILSEERKHYLHLHYQTLTDFMERLPRRFRQEGENLIECLHDHLSEKKH